MHSYLCIGVIPIGIGDNATLDNRNLLDLGNIGDCRIMTVAQFEAEWLGSED